MPFKLVFDDDRQVSVEDLPVDVINKICREHDVSWLDVYGAPAENLDVFRALVHAAADTFDTRPDLPAMDTLGETIEAMGSMIARVEKDDRPDEWNDAGIPLEEGDPTTG